MTAMDDLTAFIEARLAEDEAMAKAATEHQPYDEWDAVGAGAEDDIALSNWRVVSIAIPALKTEHAPAARSVMQHIARHDPARVLREVAAKRAMVALHAIHSEPERWGDSHPDLAMRGQPTGHASYWCATCDYDRDYGHIGGREEGCPTMRALAAVWSDHPDYDPAWSPGAPS